MKIKYGYIYVYGQHFYPKWLTLNSMYTFLSVPASPANQTHGHSVASAMLYCFSYRKACASESQIEGKLEKVRMEVENERDLFTCHVLMWRGAGNWVIWFRLLVRLC